MCTQLRGKHCTLNSAPLSTRVDPNVFDTQFLQFTGICTPMCIEAQPNGPHKSFNHLNSVFSAGEFAAVFFLQLDCSVHHRSRKKRLEQIISTLYKSKTRSTGSFFFMIGNCLRMATWQSRRMILLLVMKTSTPLVQCSASIWCSKFCTLNTSSPSAAGFTRAKALIKVLFPTF